LARTLDAESLTRAIEWAHQEGFVAPRKRRPPKSRVVKITIPAALAAQLEAASKEGRGCLPKRAHKQPLPLVCLEIIKDSCQGYGMAVPVPRKDPRKTTKRMAFSVRKETRRRLMRISKRRTSHYVEKAVLAHREANGN
jgi:hypothetical protein